MDDTGGHRPELQIGRSLQDEIDVVGVPLSDDYPDFPIPTHWPQLASADIEGQWNDLRAWVEELCTRFAHLDHHVIPRCWWRHNELVEALAALRDHERSSFSDTAPASAPVDWFRALRDISTLMRSWTADAGCGGSHQTPTAALRPLSSEDWERFVAHDKAERLEAEIAEAANG